MLDKAIAHGKEHRKPYTRGKAVDYSCRNHGSCDYCRENRLYKMRDKHFTRAEIAEMTRRKDYA